MEHHKTLPPSSAPAILECAMFESKSYSDADASKGTIFHRICEAMVLQNKPKTEDLEALEQEEIENCEWVSGEMLRFLRDQAPGHQIETEKRVEIMNDHMEIVTFGSADVLAGPVGGDWKSSFNFRKYKLQDFRAQMALYALGRMQQKGLKKMMWVIGHIMPRDITVFNFTLEECMATLDLVVKRRTNPDKAPQVCFHCQDCAKLLNCPAVNPRLKVIDQCYKQLNAPDQLLFPEGITDPGEMSRAIIFTEDILKKYMKRLDEAAKRISAAGVALAQTGVEIPYFELKKSNGRKTIDDKDGAYRALEPHMDKDTFYKGLTISIPALGRAYWEANGGKINPVTLTESKKFIEGALDSVIKFGEGKPELKRFKKAKVNL